MGQTLYIIVILAIASVIAVLMIGIGGFAKGGSFNAKYGNKMMQLRILLQAIAVALILLFVYLRNSGAFG